MTRRGWLQLTKRTISQGYEIAVRALDISTQQGTTISNSLKPFKGVKGFSNHTQHGHILTVRLITVFRQINQKINILSVLFAKQCNAIAALRIRRTAQILDLYSRIYGKQTMISVVEKFGQSLRLRTDRPLYILFSAAIFSWEKERILEKDLTEQIDELVHIARTRNISSINSVCQTKSNWEKIIDLDNLLLWRKPVPNSCLYEYKVYGTFNDIPARAFYHVQVDLDYRKEWDKLVIELDIIDKEDESGSEVVRWITHYPYPMYKREYVYLRKCMIDQERKVMLINSHATHHPSCPQNDKYVRVSTFKSNMVIKPHSTFDENGFDYVLNYYDDPQSSIPSVAYNWVASTGIPDFLDKLHMAALRLNEQKTSRTSDGGEFSADNTKVAM